jgi:hephaestin
MHTNPDSSDQPRPRHANHGSTRIGWLVALVAVIAAMLPVGVAFGASGHHRGAVALPLKLNGATRTYYIAAEEVEWDYAPSGINQITGDAFDDTANVFVQQAGDRIGKVYLKAQYREYTDGTFRVHKARAPEWEHLGLLGPVMHAEVGDTIKVVFKNNTTRAVGMHPHGVFYNKDSEGALYNDATTGADKDDDSVPPGGSHTYVWGVPERAGPGPMDPSSVMWMYHGHTDEIADDYAGLMGPIVVTRRGMAREDGSPKDVDREIVDSFQVMDENNSPYLQQNIDRFAGSPGSVDTEDEGFQESNLMHSINGYVYGNQPMVTLHKGEHVRWYLMGMGTEVDLHTPHWHGNTVTIGGMRTDVANLLPAGMVIADMTPDDPGTWLYHCHVNDHISAGMLTRYQVV